MSHECPLCFQVCYCDMEDHDQPQPDDCIHICEDDDIDEDGLYADGTHWLDAPNGGLGI